MCERDAMMRCQLEGCMRQGFPTKLEMYIKGSRLLLCDECEVLVAKRAAELLTIKMRREGKI